MAGVEPHRPLLLLAAALLAALLALGLSLQLGRRGIPRVTHHALFFAVCAVVGVAAFLSLRAGARGWALLPALGLLLLMPRTRPGRANHWGLALACAAAFGLGAWGAW
ncbi:hypothetical protein DAERI_040198 [Deinococcus aerius]|uniref:Uncharacterized protein n=1 Tax=Deinococcus aerius TaxID=200253 RepID=A0A2I9DH10_9DEIO|nr:hypothetical protein [Deinococcus aerius]GBF05438.1 hypothetical protein DAERI_040198 [Deinococcus aerius]